MKNSKQIIPVIFFVLCIFFAKESSAQDERFSQPFANILKYNPAAMGLNPDLKFNLQYRTQWGSLEKGYTTYAFTTLYPLYLKDGKEKLDIGFTALNDKAGAFNSLDFSLAVGYNVQLSESGYLNVSLLGGYVQKSLDASGLSFDEQYVLGTYSASNPNSETVLNDKVGYADVGAGIMWYFNPKKDAGAKLNAFIGVSAYHLNKPNQSLISGTGALTPRFSFQAGIKILGKNNIDFTPNIIVNAQKPAQNSAAGLIMDYNLNEKMKLVVGAWYRKGDAIAFSLGFEHKTFGLMYSYDVVTDPINSYVSGLNAHEITLSLKFNQSEKKGATANSAFF